MSPEIKHRESLPAWLKDAMDQAVAARRDDKLPVVILHEKGQKHDKDLVMFRLGDITRDDVETFLRKLREAGL